MRGVYSLSGPPAIYQQPPGEGFPLFNDETVKDEKIYSLPI
jgi:hypothetical protein